MKILLMKRATLLDNFGYFTVKKYKDRRFFYEHQTNGEVTLFDTYITVCEEEKKIKALPPASSDYQEVYQLLLDYLKCKNSF